MFFYYFYFFYYSFFRLSGTKSEQNNKRSRKSDHPAQPSARPSRVVTDFPRCLRNRPVPRGPPGRYRKSPADGARAFSPGFPHRTSKRFRLKVKTPAIPESHVIYPSDRNNYIGNKYITVTAHSVAQDISVCGLFFIHCINILGEIPFPILFLLRITTRPCSECAPSTGKMCQ